ncbi:MAG: carbamoyl-phosphate synthase large subunit [Phycisphaerales bacterium]|nr:carbamoyl-phosphate synthase large subunit [Phycisphaerales bacterium]
MPKREDIRTILIVGSGPIVIGQGCEFDYSGAQACKALRSEGYRVVLVNSNPATIMTDPAFSDRTYIEPITPDAVRKIIEKERELGEPIDALLPTLGGQTALNCACKLWDDGSLERLGVELIGASREVIHRAEDRDAFRKIVEGIGLNMPAAKSVTTMEDALEFLEEIGLPAIIRPAFTLGGAGGGVAYNREEFEDIVSRGLRASMIGQVQIDKSILGWKEYELEVVRDRNDNCVIVCGIENIDPMGVHTGDSITVAPILTLTDKEYQRMRDAAIAIMRAVGVETGGSNVQFAVNPQDGELTVVEMNPRVSRSSALASKATGFPIAKIAAKLAVGYTLDELRNDVTGSTSACFEPTIDYIVVKMPRWTFEKFPEADQTLTTQMKSVGEAMAIGRTFKEALQKAIRSMEVKRFGLGLDRNDQWLMTTRAGGAERERLRNSDGEAMQWPIAEEKLVRKLARPSQGRLYYVRYAFKMGWSVERVHELSRIDPFFLDQIRQLVEFEDELAAHARLEDVPGATMRRAKELGYSDAQLANLYLGRISPENILKVRAQRETLGVKPVYKLVDTCAAEFEAATPYFYSTYETGFTVVGPSGAAPAPPEDEARVTDRPKVVILGGGPNRIGQGIEFDYCCVHAAFAARELGYEAVMINSNPETVSTDYDTSDLLFFEPLTLEDVLNIVERLNGGGVGGRDGRGGPVMGLVVQFGGQTPLNLAHGLVKAGVPLMGTSMDSIDLAEDRKRFDALLEKMGLQRPASGVAYALEEAVAVAKRVGYPVLVRPSYVLGGRGMEVCSDERALREYVVRAVDISDLGDAPVLIDRFLNDATEVDVDVVADFDPTGEGRALICGVMEHIEQAGVHSGDSSCIVPPYSLPQGLVRRIRQVCRDLAQELRVCGLMNVQLAVKDEEVYILEVNPRASRTAPFVSKAKGVSWPSIAAKAMMGRSLEQQGAAELPDVGYFSVKAPVFPFNKFPGVDVALGPEMRSTGEVMGIDRSLPVAFAKAMSGAGIELPTEGAVFISVRDADKARIVEVARSLRSMGFGVYTSRGTGEHLARHSVRTTILQKIAEGARPNVLDLIADGRIHLVINTPTRTGWMTDEGRIRATAVRMNVPMITTATGALAAVRAIEALRAGEWTVAALQDYAGALV